MSEELARELIDVVKSSNSFSWEMTINILALIASWITIAFLLKERSENNRPYVQISFELIRSSLACIVIRNVGNVPLSIKSLTFSTDFINQISERDRAAFLNKERISKEISRIQDPELREIRYNHWKYRMDIFRDEHRISDAEFD